MSDDALNPVINGEGQKQKDNCTIPILSMTFYALCHFMPYVICQWHFMPYVI